MRLVAVGKKKYADYQQLMNKDMISELDYVIDKLRNKKIAMVNATSFGGGVAEKLHALVPLMKDMGLKVDWWNIYGQQEFYDVTKNFHNRLQGQKGDLSAREIELFLKYNSLNASDMKDWDYDFTVIHDPQPAALIGLCDRRPAHKWIWRCHIDTSTPNVSYWNFLSRYLSCFDANIFTMKEYVRGHVKGDTNLKNIVFMPPSIDPLSLKNIPLREKEVHKIISRFGVDINRPLITQISRFDPWKDPLGVIEVYKIVKKEIPGLQLALIGSMAADDPEGWIYLYKTLRRAGEDYDIKILTNFNGITNLEVNAFQTAADLVLQKSLKEGFGLTVSEALWKGTPVIGGNVGGIKMQIENGVTGYLVNTVEECAQKVVGLLRDPLLAQNMKEAGKEKVRREFLVTKNILAYLNLFLSLGEG